MRRLITAVVLPLLLLSGAFSASAQLSIEITGAGAQRIPIAIVPFAGEGALVQGISGIVRSDIRPSFGALSGTATGVPLDITLTLVNVNDNCAPLASRAVPEGGPAPGPGAGRLLARGPSRDGMPPSGTPGR
mgnify:CR=1 FL=1